MEVWYASNLRRLRLGEERKKNGRAVCVEKMSGTQLTIQALLQKKKEEEETTGQKYNVRICYAGRP